MGSPSGKGTLADTYLRLRDSAGTSITFDDDSGTGYDSRLTFTASSSGTYFLSAGSASSTGIGTYTVSATDVTPPITDDYTSTTSTTGTVSVGGTKTGSIETAGDTDWFKISLVAGVTYTFDAMGSPSGKGTLADTYLSA